MEDDAGRAVPARQGDGRPGRLLAVEGLTGAVARPELGAPGRGHASGKRATPPERADDLVDVGRTFRQDREAPSAEWRLGAVYPAALGVPAGVIAPISARSRTAAPNSRAMSWWPPGSGRSRCRPRACPRYRRTEHGGTPRGGRRPWRRWPRRPLPIAALMASSRFVAGESSTAPRAALGTARRRVQRDTPASPARGPRAGCSRARPRSVHPVEAAARAWRGWPRIATGSPVRNVSSVRCTVAIVGWKANAGPSCSVSARLDGRVVRPEVGEHGRRRQCGPIDDLGPGVPDPILALRSRRSLRCRARRTPRDARPCWRAPGCWLCRSAAARAGP